MTTVTTAPEAEYWLQTGWMEEPGAELGIRKPITIDRKTNLHEHRATGVCAVHRISSFLCWR